ncbi:MAG: LamG domain-containing protein, partial [Moorea sp. SIO3I7]|nr:LamG domain-containing protein [Moorena sp. SIO3I7]
MLAYGFITLLSLGSEYYFKYEIDAQTGFQIYWITIPEGLDKERYSKQTISEFLAESSVAQILKPGAPIDKGVYQASLILPGLPASPFDAFYTIELTYDSDSFTLGVQSTDSFGFSPEGSTHFKDLNLSFTQQLNSETATVSGTVTAVFSGQDIVLEAGLSDGSELIFNYNPNNPQEIPIQPWGNLELTTFTVKPGSNPLQPQVLYWFGEKSGEWVYDCSLRNSEDAPAIDLRIQTEPETVQWGLGSIAVKDGLIESENATLEAANLSSA